MPILILLFLVPGSMLVVTAFLPHSDAPKLSQVKLVNGEPIVSTSRVRAGRLAVGIILLAIAGLGYIVDGLSALGGAI